MSALPNQMFAGIKVLAVARVVAAPFCAMHLAVNGALRLMTHRKTVV